VASAQNFGKNAGRVFTQPRPKADSDAASAKSRRHGVTIKAVEYGEIVSHPSVK
jgi:hypothetical protein